MTVYSPLYTGIRLLCRITTSPTLNFGILFCIYSLNLLTNQILHATLGMYSDRDTFTAQ